MRALRNGREQNKEESAQEVRNRIHANLRELQLRILRDTPKGRTVDLKNINKRLSHVAMISEGGRNILWEGNMGRYLQAAGAIDPKPPTKRTRSRREATDRREAKD